MNEARPIAAKHRQAADVAVEIDMTNPPGSGLAIAVDADKDELALGKAFGLGQVLLRPLRYGALASFETADSRSA